MDNRIKTTRNAAAVSLVLTPLIVLLMGGGLGNAVMGEVIVIDVFIVLAIMIFGLVE